MAAHTLKEVSVPYTVSAEDESIGRDTIVIRRMGEPVAVVIPFADYQALVAQPLSGDLSFEQERAPFQRLLPELLKTRRGEWVAIVGGEPVEFGLDFSSVIVPVRRRFGQRPVYVREISEQPRAYDITCTKV
ncbi:hypothetical protein TFLX_00612 [Thermoflexales bacterium]|nr:hypothetical protein TFLX_00612 [Thermoflexales bacterium]